MNNISEILTLKEMGFIKNDGIKEYMVPSTDKIDILFRNTKGVVGVEIKSKKSDDADLYRGIYQCIKYKYLLQAELLENGEYPFAECILVVQRELPEVLKKLVKRFNLKYFICK